MRPNPLMPTRVAMGICLLLGVLSPRAGATPLSRTRRTGDSIGCLLVSGPRGLYHACPGDELGRSRQNALALYIDRSLYGWFENQWQEADRMAPTPQQITTALSDLRKRSCTPGPGRNAAGKVAVAPKAPPH